MKTIPLSSAISSAVALGALSLLAGCGGSSDSEPACEALTGMTAGSATVVKASSISGAFTSPDGTKVSQAFCRAEVTLKPSADSDIHTELWLPPASSWNNRYLGVGNGGFNGQIGYGSMVSPLQAGYAVSSTDTGHSGDSTASAWAVGHPEKLVDNGWRAIHETAIASKAIVNAYYSKAADHSYFSGCSTGGRQALMEAQRSPEDYDGILAGDPNSAIDRLQATVAAFLQYQLTQPGAGLPPSKLATITNAVLASCGGPDGFVEDPGQCHFDPAALLCTAADSDSCLTAPQVATVRKIYAGTSDANGQRLYAGYAPGSEAGKNGWADWITGTGQSPTVGATWQLFNNGFWGDFVYGGITWDPRAFNLDRDLGFADGRVGDTLNATNPDLSPFSTRGGKLIQYHGWADSVVPPQSSIDYHQTVADKMGGADKIAAFYRLFMVPGMQHCSGGPGPNKFDGLSALTAWVEKGEAPTQLLATKYVNDDVTKGIAIQRQLCVHPQVAHYSGQGSRAEAANYVCQ
jgi:hypothetical protein